MSLLSVKDLEVEFKIRDAQSWFWQAPASLKAVNRISFELQAGETLGIVGESGSGKSLTAKALAGLLPRYATVQGLYSLLDDTVDLAGGERSWRALRGGAIVWLPQDPFSSLDPLHTCGTQIAAGMRSGSRA